jgi:L-threonylcarbamoyladenylate synthase
MRPLDADELDIAADALADGQLVVVPTQRWYMICANAADADACERIFAAKHRSRAKSLAYVIPSLAAADKLFYLTPPARALAAAFWPGDLALILRWRDAAVGQRHTAVGTPNALVTCDPGVLGQLVRHSRIPVAATTVNVSNSLTETGSSPAITLAEAEQFAAETHTDIAYAIKGGICPLANQLTIIDCTTTEPTTSRAGLVHSRAITAALRNAVQPQSDELRVHGANPEGPC